MKNCKLELASLPRLCQEMLANWKHITDSMASHATTHEMQGVLYQVSLNVAS